MSEPRYPAGSPVGGAPPPSSWHPPQPPPPAPAPPPASTALPPVADDAPAPFFGVLAALGVLLLQASVVVPTSLMIVLGLAASGCASGDWSYPMCAAGTGWLLAGLAPAVVGLGTFVVAIAALASSRRRPQRAGALLGIGAIALVVLATLVPAAAGVPYFT